MNKEKIDKLIIRWLERSLSEQTTLLNIISKRIAILNYQSHNFQDMRSEVDRQKVIDDLFADFRSYGWNDTINELLVKLSDCSENLNDN